jgi:predicted Zn-dependent protease
VLEELIIMANTDAYLLLGLGVVTVILGGYVLTLVARMRGAARRIVMLRSLAETEQ